MVRVARKSNTGIVLPCDKAQDAPAELMVALQHADHILSWYENISTEEIPPTWMWPFPDELDEWFEEVALARKQKYGGGGDDNWGDMVSNEWDG